ncbi:alginate export family protein [Aquirufa sp. ROCK-SH2]
MKYLFIALLNILLIFNIDSNAQYFGKSRSDDNLVALQKDTLLNIWARNLKHIQLDTSQKWKLAIGGELRYNYQNYEHFNFGEVPSTFLTDSPQQLLQRVMLHAALSTKNKFRVFLQFNHTERFFNNNPINNQSDEDIFSIHQFFLEIPTSKNAFLRLGKQEEVYGGERLLASREGPNTRMTHAGMHFRYKQPNLLADVFWVRPMIMKPGALDDELSKEDLIGVYFSNVDFHKPYLFDFYSIYFQSPKREYLFKIAEEKRNSIGFRFISKPNKWQYSIENVYQFGSFGESSISAFMSIFDVSRQIHHYYTLGFSGNWVPGDKNYDDNQLNTFNTLFSRPPFGQTVSLNITNTLNLSPYFRFHPNDFIQMTLRGSFVTRESLKDGLFSPNMSPMRPILNHKFESTARNVGNIFTLETNLNLTRSLQGLIEFGYCEAGDYLKDTGNGKDVFYFAMRAAYKF